MKRLFFILFAALCLVACKEDFSHWKNINTTWLSQNKQKNDSTLQVTGTGLQYVAHETGYGAIPHVTSLVTVKYEGRTAINNAIFERSDSVVLAVSNVIPGWQEALCKMKQGSHWTIYIPYTLGYGSEGTKTTYGTYKIPPYTTLVFDIDLIDVTNY